MERNDIVINVKTGKVYKVLQNYGDGRLNAIAVNGKDGRSVRTIREKDVQKVESK